MPFIEWSKQLSTDIPSIDRQHKVLIDLINKLDEAINEGEAYLMLELILKDVLNYTRVHFAYEEMLFKIYKYSDEKNHNIGHHKLLAKASHYHARFCSGDSDIATELMEFLKEWLTRHIMGEDMAYAKVLIKQGVQQAG